MRIRHGVAGVLVVSLAAFVASCTSARVAEGRIGVQVSGNFTGGAGAELNPATCAAGVTITDITVTATAHGADGAPCAVTVDPGTLQISADGCRAARSRIKIHVLDCEPPITVTLTSTTHLSNGTTHSVSETRTFG